MENTTCRVGATVRPSTQPGKLGPVKPLAWWGGDRWASTIQVSGGALDTEDTLEAAAVAPGGEITSLSLAEIAASIRAYYAARGFAKASVDVDTNDTDAPEGVVLTILITPGPPRTIARRTFVIDPRADREVGSPSFAGELPPSW